MNKAVFIGRVKYFDHNSKTLILNVQKEKNRKNYEIPIEFKIESSLRSELLKKTIKKDMIVKVKCYIDVSTKRQIIKIIGEEISFLSPKLEF